MEYEWDEIKRLQNIAKHGVDFEAMAFFDWETAIILSDTRHDYGEQRSLAYGEIAGRLHACVCTQREGVMRIISLRKANQREELSYEKNTQTAH